MPAQVKLWEGIEMSDPRFDTRERGWEAEQKRGREGRSEKGRGRGIREVRGTSY